MNTDKEIDDKEIDNKINELDGKLSEEPDNSDSDNESNSEKNDNKDDNKDNKEVNVSKEFNEKANEYIKLDDECRELKKRKDILEAKKKPLEDYLLKYLEKSDYGTIEFPNGSKLRRNKSETKEALKANHFKDALKNKLKNDKMVEDILNTMNEMRETKTHVNLKRTNSRKK